jgi:hypothetical protein
MTAKERFEEAIQFGRQDMANSLHNIADEFRIRVDQVVKSEKISIKVGSEGALMVETPERPFTPTDYATGQIFSHYGIPRTFGAKLHEWDMDALLEKNFEEIGHGRFAGDGVMLRTVGNNLKGWLSPSYRRIDAAPVLESFVEAAVNQGMVPMRGFNTDTRYQLRFVLPDIMTPLGMENEATVFGASLTTSDYGAGAFKAELFLMRLICLNGMIGQQMFRRVHVGSRFESSDDVSILSDTTHALDVRTMASAVRDLVRVLPARKEAIKSKIEEAFEKEPSRAAWEMVRKATDKGTFEKIKNTYDEQRDVALLPEKPSAWRLANAISLIAQGQDNSDKRIDLEALAMNAVA